MLDAVYVLWFVEVAQKNGTVDHPAVSALKASERDDSSSDSEGGVTSQIAPVKSMLRKTGTLRCAMPFVSPHHDDVTACLCRKIA